jgi:hypothetical protein
MEAQAFWRRLQCDPTLCTYVDSVNPLPRRPRIHDSVGDLLSIHSVMCLVPAFIACLSSSAQVFVTCYSPPTGACNLADHPMAPRNIDYPGRAGAVSPL